MGEIIKFKNSKKQNPFISSYIERWIFEDKNISWAAKRIVAYMLAMHKSGNIFVKDLYDMVPGQYKEQTSKAIKELKANYINLKA